jgi:hypothetical protein
VVGFRRNHPDFIHRMVGRLSQRVVLEVALSTLEIRVQLSGRWARLGEHYELSRRIAMPCVVSLRRTSWAILAALRVSE